MEPKALLHILAVAERLKDATRHCYTSDGRHESVAEHSWMAALMAYLMKDEFPEADMNKVMVMCLIHDLGEAFTGDIPSFLKTEADEQREDALLAQWVATLPPTLSAEMAALYEEMTQRQTLEARIFKAIDGMEAVIQHNASDLSTWIPHEYQLNLTYADDKVSFSPYLTKLRQAIREVTLQKLSISDNTQS
ncbi:MAG: HD domain-containing protein [Ruminococcaceae bacterium]|nr:HD domain-containing protein [Oscillospiraceae bacterium]